MVRAKARKAIAAMSAFLMMYAQAVYAVDACVEAGATAARAVAEETGMTDCETMKIESSCLAQCTFDNQSSAKPVLEVPPTPAEVVLTLSAGPDNAARGLADLGSPMHCCGPAPPLQFCRFLL